MSACARSPCLLQVENHWSRSDIEEYRRRATVNTTTLLNFFIFVQVPFIKTELPLSWWKKGLLWNARRDMRKNCLGKEAEEWISSAARAKFVVFFVYLTDFPREISRERRTEFREKWLAVKQCSREWNISTFFARTISLFLSLSSKCISDWFCLRHHHRGIYNKILHLCGVSILRVF